MLIVITINNCPFCKHFITNILPLVVAASESSANEESSSSGNVANAPTLKHVVIQYKDIPRVFGTTRFNQLLSKSLSLPYIVIENKNGELEHVDISKVNNVVEFLRSKLISGGAGGGVDDVKIKSVLDTPKLINISE